MRMLRPFGIKVCKCIFGRVIGEEAAGSEEWICHINWHIKTVKRILKAGCMKAKFPMGRVVIQ